MPVKSWLRRWFPRRSIGHKLVKFAHKKSAAVVRPANFQKNIEVIIPCYNHASNLSEAYGSVLGQTWPGPISITLIDDNSTDNTWDEIKRLISATKDSRIHIKTLKNTANLRQWGSLNKAIAASSNQLIIILNDDDMLTADAIEKIVLAFKSRHDVYMVGGSSLWFEDKTKPTHKPLPFEKLHLAVAEPHLVEGYVELNDLNMTHSSCAFMRVAWEAVGGYYPKHKRISPQANEDRDFQMRVNSLFCVGVFKDYPLAFWRTDSSHGKNF